PAFGAAQMQAAIEIKPQIGAGHGPSIDTFDSLDDLAKIKKPTDASVGFFIYLRQSLNIAINSSLGCVLPIFAAVPTPLPADRRRRWSTAAAHFAAPPAR